MYPGGNPPKGLHRQGFTGAEKMSWRGTPCAVSAHGSPEVWLHKSFQIYFTGAGSAFLGSFSGVFAAYHANTAATAPC